MFKRKIIIITGPTASGKSDITLRLAKEVNGVIINGDSRQVYKELEIGTAKPTFEKTTNNISYIDNIPHYLYSTVSIKEKYTVYDYQKDAYSILKALPDEQVPIIVGGTGLYIDSLFFNYELTENISNDSYKKYSLDELKELIGEKKLSKLNESDRENPRRLVRILQKIHSHSYKEKDNRKEKALNALYFVVDIEPEELNRKIEKRVEVMFEKGLIEENRRLLKYKELNLPALNTIGYQEFDGYFENKKDLEQVKQEIINHSRQYAKRQRTWFRKNNYAIWINNYKDIKKMCKEFLLN
ncbi:MAG: tRNA (adenosine(37)-N6)-dimethylallyltransferase MiaA [Candidatus Dojkabacteria bacterium]